MPHIESIAMVLGILASLATLFQYFGWQATRPVPPASSKPTTSSSIVAERGAGNTSSKMYWGIPRGVRASGTIALVFIGFSWCSGSVIGIKGRLSKPAEPHIESEVPDYDVSQPMVRSKFADHLSTVDKCDEEKKWAISEMLRVRDHMAAQESVRSALGGRAGELRKSRWHTCPTGVVAYHQIRQRDVAVLVVNDNLFAYFDEFFEETGQSGLCRRASWEIAIEACQRFGGCYHVQRDGGSLPSLISDAVAAAYQSCMGWAI